MNFSSIISLVAFSFIHRLVYKWFYFIYKLSYTLGIIGYVIMLATFFGFNLIFDVKPHVWMDCGLLFVFYGLYFGVLGRDIAEICADKMASHVGVSRILIQRLHRVFILSEYLKKISVTSPGRFDDNFIAFIYRDSLDLHCIDSED